MSWDRTLISTLVAIALIAAASSGCNRMLLSKHDQLNKDADSKSGEGDYAKAINLYEMALDGTARSAEVHYKLALLYDDKLNDPLHALHHFKRYVALAPAGPHAAEVKNFIKRDEVALVTNLSGDAVVTRAEAARLRNENLNLRKVLDENAAVARGSATNENTASRAGTPVKTATPEKKSEKTSRTYVVKRGDTLASISRKFYKSTGRWKRILDANRKKIDDPEKLKVGESLIIP